MHERLKRDEFMHERIRQELTKVEHANGVRILYAVESGSRVWGFESPDSDYDVRFVYQRPLAWYMSVHERRDVIELALIKDANLDITGWDLKKALYQAAKGNPQFVEWLRSPVVYRPYPRLEALNAIATRYFNPRTAIYHYLHMANGNYRQYLRDDEVRLKKYLYVLRPLLCCVWIETRGGPPPVTWNELEVVADWHPEVAIEVAGLLWAKRAGGELGTGPKRPGVNAWIELKLEHFANLAKTTAKGPQRSDDVDEFLLSSGWGEL